MTKLATIYKQGKDRLKAIINKSASLEPIKSYRIVAVDDSYQDTGKIYVKVQVTGMSKTFDRPVAELYQKEWLEKFSREDVAHIAALYTAEHTHNLELIKQFPKTTAANKASVIVVGILFTAFLILSNLTAFKIASIGGISFAAGLVFFPITYVFDDILTEVYGFSVSRRIIWMALFANMIIFLGTWLTVYLTPSPFWQHQIAYSIIYKGTPIIFIASMVSYLAGEFTNSIILAKLKIFTAGRYLWLRAISSTMIGVGIDSIFFIHLAFFQQVPYLELWKMIATMYCFKVIYEACAIPITYKIANYLKRKDNIDYYDFKTNFNPFSLKV